MTTPAPAAVKLRVELPFTARAPRLINPELGIDRVLVLRGAGRRSTTQLTVLDTPDHRLLRAGVLLAHRVADGRGDWFLAAPDWAPWLPGERVEPMADGDLPTELAALVRPFRRSAALGPVAALEYDRWTYALHGAGQDGETRLGVLHDQLVTVRTAGVITSRYREGTLTGDGIDAAQRDWVSEMLAFAGGTVVEEFPSIAQRIGSPATGHTDFPAPTAWQRDCPAEAAITAILAGRLRMIMTADLALRGGSGAARDLAEQLRALAVELRGLGPLLVHDQAGVAEWRSLADRLDDAAELDAIALINSGRYLGLLDALVREVRAPRVVGGIDTSGALSAGDAFGALLERVVADFVEACDVFGADGPDATWRAALLAGDQLIHSSTITELVRPKRAARLRRRTERLMADLEQCVGEPPAITDRVEELSPAEAFEAGRAHERARIVVRHARHEFLRKWGRARERFA
ncbi:hypothetical protein [Naumannella huperziae]